MTRQCAVLALSAACLLATQACYDKGSCSNTTSYGFDYCQEFLGTEYIRSVAQDDCAAASGKWSEKACAHDHALGRCAVDPADTGKAQNFLYTYYATPGASAPATTLTAETACGLVGGVFTAE